MLFKWRICLSITENISGHLLDHMEINKSKGEGRIQETIAHELWASEMKQEEEGAEDLGSPAS